LKRHIRQIPIPLLTSPLKGEEAINYPPHQGEGEGGGGVKPEWIRIKDKIRCLYNYGLICNNPKRKETPG